MITCVRRLQFCAGHRVWKHESKCAFLHGHNYVAMLHATAPDLDSIGRIIDFGDLKRLVGGWLEEQWDHGFILFKEDEEAIEAVRSIPGQKLYLLDTNPTAENMADHLLRTISPKLLADTGVQVIRVVLWETENCFAEACL